MNRGTVMPNHRYSALTEDAPTLSRAFAAPSRKEAHCSRLREVVVRIPCRRAYGRRSPRNTSTKAPILEENCHCSLCSPSPPTKRDGAACRELSSVLETSPSCAPKGNVVFTDSNPEREERNVKTVIVPPKDVLLPCPLSPDLPRTFLSNPKCSSSAPSSPAGCFNVTTSRGPTCRICHEGDQQESLMSLCKCSGTMGLMHVSCLERWMNARNVNYCEVCHQCFPTVTQANCVRRFFDWVLQGASQRALLEDLLCFALLTPVAAISCFLCGQKASMQALDGHVNQAASLVALAGVLVAAYLAWSFLTARFHYRAFMLWQAKTPIRRVLVPSFANGAGGNDRTAAGQPACLREMSNVVAGSVREDAAGDFL
ncbi:hypothetical protein MTO96_006994 [Rhipicephalus appendiculatus]